jgi:hypothetical protein
MGMGIKPGGWRLKVGNMAVEQVQIKVQRILTEELGLVRLGSDGAIILENDSATGFVRVLEWGDDQTIVKVSSTVLWDVPLVPDLFQWVATEGQLRWFAHYRVLPGEDGTGELVLEHDLLGEFLDPAELIETVISVMMGADEMDEDLQSRFGGMRSADL